MFYCIVHREFGIPPIKFADIVTIQQLKTYLEEIVFPKTFPKGTKGHRYLSYMNYVVGLRITLKRSELVRNNDKISKALYPEIRPKVYKDPFKKYSTQSKEKCGTYTYSEAGTYKGRGGYSKFFPYGFELDNSEDIFDTIDDAFKHCFEDIRTFSIIIEFMFYNINYDTIVYIAHGFLIEGTGTLMNDRRWRTFNPNLYVAGRNDAKLISIYVFQILFQVMILYEIIKIIIKFCYYAIDIFTGKRVYIFLNDVFSIITVAFGLTCVIYWYVMRSTLQYFKNLFVGVLLFFL